jgi:hypothetical protein
LRDGASKKKAHSDPERALKRSISGPREFNDENLPQKWYLELFRSVDEVVSADRARTVLSSIFLQRRDVYFVNALPRASPEPTEIQRTLRSASWENESS